MSKDIREMINKVKNFKGTINENMGNDNYVDIDFINQIPKGETFHDRMNVEYYEKLKNDIGENGILEPIILNYYFKDNAINLKEGHHRLKIANELGINRVPVKIMVIWDRNIKDNETIFNPPITLDITEYTKRNYYPTFIEPTKLGLI